MDPWRIISISQNWNSKTGHLVATKRCYHCGEGKLGLVMLRGQSKVVSRRCTRKVCQRFCPLHHGHPIFNAVGGPSSRPLNIQAAVLHCAVWGVPVSNFSTLIPDVSRKQATRIYSEWRRQVALYVEAHQANIRFGSNKSNVLDEIEVDEAVFRKSNVGGNAVQWHEFVGAKRRGDPSSLVLHRRPAGNSVSLRAVACRRHAVPPPKSKSEWNRIRDAHVGEGTLVHSDGSLAYRNPPSGVAHDHVNHGSSERRRPQFSGKRQHITRSGQPYQSVGGTQSIDGWWTWAKKATAGVRACDDTRVEHHIREAQWRHWIGTAERWSASGAVLSWAQGDASK